MRFRVPKEALVVAALVLAVVIPSSRHAYKWLRRISANKQLNISDGLARPESSSDPQVLLAEANRLYWLNNGPKAAPLYAKAEKFFTDRGDTRNQIYSQIGRLRSEAETMSFVDLSRFLNDQLQNPIMRNDPRLRLWCLAAKGYTDIEIDYQAEKQDWLEALQIAKNLGDDRLATRASGELASYYLAHSARADMYRRLGRTAEARASYEKALALTQQEPERQFLQERIRQLK